MYPRVSADFKNIHGYFLSGYPMSKQTDMDGFFFDGSDCK